jgi:predicted benzoate:H+ symporter BenE
MASLDRAYGARGALLAVGMAVIAGGVHGVLSHLVDMTLVKVAFGVAAAIVLIMAGAISARQSMWSAVTLGLAMWLGFLLARWFAWSFMDGGFFGLSAFLAHTPFEWGTYLSDRGVSRLWVVEAFSFLAPTMFGTIVGHEREP